MDAMMVCEYNKPLERRHYALPSPKGCEVLVQTQFAGVCHSDLHLHSGHFNIGNGKKAKVPFRPPFTLGHEIEGTVVAVGDELISSHASLVGKRFAVYPWIGCGESQCVNCGSHKENLCNGAKSKRFCDGRSIYGGYGSHVLVPDAKYLVEIPSCIPPGLSCIYMCSGLTAFSALKKVKDHIRTAKDLVIMGMGGVGQQAVTFANALLGDWPIVVELDPAKRLRAQNMGCIAVDPSDQKACVKEIRRASIGGKGVLAAIDFVGMEPTFKTCYSSLRAGGKVVVVGLFGAEITLPLYEMILAEKSVATSMVGSYDDCLEMMRLVKSAQVIRYVCTDPMELPAHQFRSILDANEALTELKNGSIDGRTILRHDWNPTIGTKL